MVQYSDLVKNKTVFEITIAMRAHEMFNMYRQSRLNKLKEKDESPFDRQETFTKVIVQAYE